MTGTSILGKRPRPAGRVLVMLAVLALFLPVPGAWALAPEAARLLQAALNFQKNGRLDEAAMSYEQAIRVDATVLRANDQGLIPLLHERYRKLVAERPEDPRVLEGMGFVLVTCNEDYAGGLEFYSKALARSTDTAERGRLTGQIEICKARLGVATPPASATEPASDGRPADPVASLTNPGLEAQKEKKMAELTKAKESSESRIAELEGQIEALREEIKKNRRLYNSSNDRRYKRKEDASGKAIEVKERQIDKYRDKLGKIEATIDRVSHGDLLADVPKGGDEEDPDGAGPGGEPSGEPEDDVADDPDDGTGDHDGDPGDVPGDPASDGD
ncbi:MAG: hypothetical protein GX442_13335 [Candidatus Riflebacteria bacterium]|nr:hypothetical protein [Candidatus Riflebacteria bacterium]